MVWSGILNNTTVCAIMTPRLERMSHQEFLREAEILTTLKHKHVMQVCRSSSQIRLKLNYV